MNVPAGRDCWPTLRAASLADSSHGAGNVAGNSVAVLGRGACPPTPSSGRRVGGLSGWPARRTAPVDGGTGQRRTGPRGRGGPHHERVCRSLVAELPLSVRVLRPAGGSIHPLPGLLRRDSRQLLFRVIEMVQPQPLNATAAGHITRSTSSATLLRRATRLPGGPARRGGLERASSCR